MKFRTFRRVYLGLVVLISCACAGLSVYVHPLVPQGGAAPLVLFPIIITVIIILSIIRNPLLQSPQLVVHEVGGSLIVSVFQIVLSFLFGFFTLTLDTSPPSPLFALKLLIYLDDFLVTLYTFGIALASVLTMQACDNNVGSRDIESSPSPFPVARLLSYTSSSLPKIPLFHTRRASQHATPPTHPQLCLPGCNCTSKVPEDLPIFLQPACYIPRIRRPPPSASFNRTFWPRHLGDQHLIRIPNESERRTSIYIHLV